MNEEQATQLVQDLEASSQSGSADMCAQVAEAKELIGCNETPARFPSLCGRLDVLWELHNCDNQGGGSA